MDSDEDDLQYDDESTEQDTASGLSGEGSIAGSAQETYMAHHQQLHVDYILVAEFDIDNGPTMEHQYPTPISGDEHMLAELMLPDQAHVRSQDWTMFFLHKEEEDDEESEEYLSQQPLIYVLNLVNTKHDKDLKRKAKFKAMAICTRHSFLHIYKPILLLALEEYFARPTVDTLAELFESVNAMDLSGIPTLSIFERQILSSSENKEMLAEKFEELIHNSHMHPTESAFNTFHPDGLASKTTYFDLANGMQGRKRLLNGKIAISKDSHEYETSVTYNGVKVPIKVPIAFLPETVGDFSIIQLITTFSTPHSQSPQAFPLHNHLTTNGPYTHPIIVLINALLTQKRVVFLGHGRPSSEVADHVLAACALVSGGILKGFTRHAFPYTDLSKIDELLFVPGFIAGVTNPMFALQPSWWDVLCDIDTGRITISKDLKPPPLTEGFTHFNLSNSMTSADYLRHDNLDNAFMDDVLHCISSRFGEWAVRTRWRDWVARFTRMAAAFEETVYGASALWIGHEENHVIRGHGYVWADETLKNKDLAANAGRIEGWRGTRSYNTFVQDLAKTYQAKPIKIVDLHHQLDRLRVLRLSPDESEKIYMVLKNYVYDYEEINQLLCLVPETQNGIFPIAFGLFHPNQKVRFAVVELLERISAHMAGRHFFNNMNRFQKLAFVRLQQEKENAANISSPAVIGSPPSQRFGSFSPSGMAVAAGGGSRNVTSPLGR